MAGDKSEFSEANMDFLKMKSMFSFPLNGNEAQVRQTS